MSAATTLPDHAAALCALMTDIPRVLRGLGLPVKRRGAGYVIPCPWHPEKTPSCSITIGQEGTLRAHCHGCGHTGNVLHLVARVRALDGRSNFRSVLHEAACIQGVTLDMGPAGLLGSGPLVGPTSPVPSPTAARVKPLRPDLDTFHEHITRLLAACPLDGNAGVGLATRGLIREADSDGWGELPVNRTGGRGEDYRGREDMDDLASLDDPAADALLAHLDATRLGAFLPWLVRNGRLAYPKHRLLIPWRTPQGKVWLLQRRWAPSFGDESAKGVDGGKYREDARAESPAYPYGIDASELHSAAEVWLVEGAADVLAVRALVKAGAIPTGAVPLGLPGVAGWDRVKGAVLPLVAGRSVVIATDNDPAGHSAVEKIAADLRGPQPSRIQRARPSVKDWAEELGRRIRAGDSDVLRVVGSEA